MQDKAYCVEDHIRDMAHRAGVQLSKEEVLRLQGLYREHCNVMQILAVMLDDDQEPAYEFVSSLPGESDAR